MYLYCGNNPVNRFDPDGHLFRSLIRGAKRIYKSVASKVSKAWISVTRYVQKKVNVRVSSSNSVRHKISIKGIGNVSYTQTTRNSASTNKSAGVSVWKNYGSMTTHNIFSGNVKTDVPKSGTGITANIGPVKGGFSAVTITKESWGVRSTVGFGSISSYSGVNVNLKDMSVDINLGVSHTDQITTNSSELTFGIGALPLAGGATEVIEGIGAGVGEVAKIVIGIFRGIA